jgi:hypothetical protein
VRTSATFLPAARRWLLSLTLIICAQAGAETATFTLDEQVRPPFNPICPETVAFRDGDAALTLDGGGLITGNPILGNPSTIYVASSTSLCGASLRMNFNPPAANPSFTLIVPSFWRDRYRITASLAFTGATHSQTVELHGTSQQVTFALSNVASISVVPLQQLGLFGWIHSIDDISFEYQPAATWDAFDFDLTPNLPEERRRALMHKYRAEDAYPTVWQQQDRAIEIVGTAANASGSPAAGVTVHFRVIDPPDTAPYIPAADRRAGDNQGGAGVLSATFAVTDASGRARTTLTITDRFAGDNYQIEASPDPQFSCAPNCSRSGIITAWKRVYVEQNRMFRRGTLLLEDIMPGQMEIRVVDWRLFPEPPFRVKLVHAPRVREIGGEFYEELVEIVDSLPEEQPGHPNAGRLVTAGPVRNFYFSADRALGAMRRYLSDGVGLWTDTPADHLTADFSAVANTYHDAFVEYVLLPDHLAGTDGSIPRLDFGTLQPADGVEMQRDLFAFKWGRTNNRPGGAVFAQPNHQVVYVANRSDRQASLRGLTTVFEGFNDTFLFMSQLSFAQSREASVHELAHQWLVNNEVPRHEPGSGGHCNTATRPTADRFIYNRPGQRCTMTSTDTVSTDGIIGFHYATIAGQSDSEYLRIRERVEPVPQDELISAIRQRYWP